MRSRNAFGGFLNSLALAPVLVAAVLGCGQDNESPTAPASEPALATATSPALVFKQVSSGRRASLPPSECGSQS